jgi:hypothetical protein
VPRDLACVPPAQTPPNDGGDAWSCDPPSDPADIVLISDLENKSLQITMGGVHATWFESDDQTGGCARKDVAPITDVRCDSNSHYAMRLTTAGLTNWGADVGFSPNPVPGTDEKQHGPFDTSAYTGIEFWAKSGTIPFPFEFKVVDQSGDPSGGDCAVDASTTDPKACYIPFLARDTAETHWRKYRFPIAQLMLARTSEAVSADAGPNRSSIYQILWGIPPALHPADWHQYDLWIDDVAWYR